MKRPSLAKAIAQNCKECIYDPTNGGTWREQVALCMISACPFYGVRPLPAGQYHDWQVNTCGNNKNSIKQGGE